MYFEKFPKTVYTLDEYRSGQVVTDILRRTKFINTLTENFAFFDEYDIGGGETPEIVADIFYNDPMLHWVILQANEILDPRFEWPLDEYNLYEFTKGKYNSAEAIHHFENSSGNIINGNVRIVSNAEFVNFNIGSVITNNTNVGVGFISSKDNTSAIVVTVSSGGFQTGDVILLSSNANVRANVTATTTLSGIPITNFEYESDLNEQKRRIKVIKPELVAEIITNFETAITR